MAQHQMESEMTKGRSVRVGRPMGELAAAMLAQACERPGTVRELAARSGVGYRLARYTASRMLERGELVKVLGSRPAVVAAAGAQGVCLLPGALVTVRSGAALDGAAALAQQLFGSVKGEAAA